MSEKPRILVIDDERAIARAVCLRLRAAGYDASSAYDGREGLTLARTRAPDAIILDLRMPVMDGLEMLSALRSDARLGTVPVVVLSANVADHAGREALARGANFVVEKPFNPEQLLSALRAALGIIGVGAECGNSH